MRPSAAVSVANMPSSTPWGARSLLDMSRNMAVTPSAKAPQPSLRGREPDSGVDGALPAATGSG